MIVGPSADRLRTTFPHLSSNRLSVGKRHAVITGLSRRDGVAHSGDSSDKQKIVESLHVCGMTLGVRRCEVAQCPEKNLIRGVRNVPIIPHAFRTEH